MGTRTDPATWPDRYGDALYRHALVRLRDPMAAEEMVQETFLAALQGRERFAGDAAEKTWLIGILKHKIVDHLRKAAREQPYEDREFQALLETSFDERGHWKIDIGNWSDPDRALERDRFWEALDECVARLPRRLAALFVMRELDGLASAEICELLELSTTNNVWVQLSRMRLRLRQCLDVRWFGHHTG